LVDRRTVHLSLLNRRIKRIKPLRLNLRRNARKFFLQLLPRKRPVIQNH